MPTLVFLAIAYQIQNIKWRYVFLALAAINLIFNIVNNAWVQEVYAAVIAFLLYTLNPFFLTWWRNRNSRNNPSSFVQFLIQTLQIAKFNKLKITCWLIILAVSTYGVYVYTEYTGYTLLGWLLGICLVIYIFKNVFYSILPPEWFLHDINTGYVFLSVLIAWGVSQIMYEKLGVHFILPMLLTTIFCLFGIYLAQQRENLRVFVPGCSLILSDIVWQIIRYFQSDMYFSYPFLITEVLLIIAMLIGLGWLIKKPGILPIVYLALFQLFRFSAFTYQAIDRSISDMLTTPEVTYYILYLVCWMYIFPLIFWFSGVIQQKNMNQTTEV